MQASHLRTVIGVGRALIAFSLLSFGCGNAEAPKIKNVRLSYWDTFTDDGTWVPLEDGGVAPQSPIRMQGKITDNTAVVSPRIAWYGERGDVKEDGFVECTKDTTGFYECAMSCAETQEGFFECNPQLPARELIRGDRFLLTGTKAGDETFELDVSISEAQELTNNNQVVDLEYRILRVSSVEGDSSLIWSVYQKTTDCHIWKPLEKSCGVDNESGDWRPLRSGDSLCWQPESYEESHCSIQIALKQTEGEDAIDSLDAAWRSLVKWNDDASLNWDAKTGSFEETFQVFDPRDRQEVTDEEDVPAFRFTVSAQDVPDQKTGVFRYSELSQEFLFAPVTATQAPDLEVDGEDEDLVETSDPAQNVTGSVKSFSGEVRSLVFSLSDGSGEPSRSRSFYFNPDLISVGGTFVATPVYVSDWNGDGIVDEPEEEDGGIPNSLTVMALDMQGNWTQTNVPIVFTPSTSSDRAPEIQLREIFPQLNDDGEALLPFGEELRLRVRAADDRGQPAFSDWACECNGEEPLINEDRCPCSLLDSGDLNAGGEFPRNPWEWIVVRPASESQVNIAVVRATERVADQKALPEATFSAVEIALEPESEAEAYNVSVSLTETIGPTVILTNLKNGDPVEDPDKFSIEATIVASVSELNQIVALWNGKPPGEEDPKPEYTSGLFTWDLQGKKVKEGDRICVGATSVTGHATLNLLEFATIAGTEPDTDRLLLGVTVTSDAQACAQVP